MPTFTSYEDERRGVLIEMMDTAVEIMKGYPPGFFPSQTEKIETQQELQHVVDNWHPEMFGVFLTCSRILATGIFESGYRIGYTINPENQDQFTLEEVMLARLVEAATAARRKLPYATLITLMLGDSAPSWLSRDINGGGFGPGKIQPQEITRANWFKTRQMKDQVQVEQELLLMTRFFQPTAKTMVAAAWTMVALAAHMQPNVFWAEIPTAYHIHRRWMDYDI